MREAFAAVLYAIEAVELDNVKYAPAGCDTCIHRDKAVTESPCSSCITVTDKTMRSTEGYYWVPNEDASTAELEEYYRQYGTPEFDVLIKHRPARCINKKCKHGRPTAGPRGLCKNCHYILESLVEADKKTAEWLSLLFWLCDSSRERETIQEMYMDLYTWDRFIMDCLCLPLPEEEECQFPDRELILYYRQARLNKQRGAEDPTPTEKQFKRILSGRQQENARNYLEFKEK